MKILSFLKKFFTQISFYNKGTTLIEFALIAPLLLVGLFGIIHVSYVSFIKQTLDRGLQEGLAQSKITPADATTLIVKAVNKFAFGLFVIDASNVKIVHYAKTIDALNKTNSLSGAGKAGEIAHYRVEYHLKYTYLTVSDKPKVIEIIPREEPGTTKLHNKVPTTKKEILQNY